MSQVNTELLEALKAIANDNWPDADMTAEEYAQSVVNCAESAVSEPVIDDLSMMVRRLVLVARRHVGDDHKDLTFANDCLKWLQTKGLAGSPLRDTTPPAAAVSEPVKPVPRKVEIPPAPIGMDEVCYVEGWNACCDAFFGGLPPQEPVVITVTATPPAAVPLSDEQIDAIVKDTCNWSLHDACRAIEAAHGITGEKE